MLGPSEPRRVEVRRDIFLKAALAQLSSALPGSALLGKARSLLVRSLDGSVVRSLDRSVDRSRARTPHRSPALSLHRALARSIARSLARSLADVLKAVSLAWLGWFWQTPLHDISVRKD